MFKSFLKYLFVHGLSFLVLVAILSHPYECELMCYNSLWILEPFGLEDTSGEGIGCLFQPVWSSPSGLLSYFQNTTALNNMVIVTFNICLYYWSYCFVA